MKEISVKFQIGIEVIEKRYGWYGLRLPRK